MVQRGDVHGRVGDAQTEASRRPLPCHPYLFSRLDELRKRSPYTGPQDWVFANDSGRPRWQESILDGHLKPAAARAGIGKIGWHTFRHTYSTMSSDVLKAASWGRAETAITYFRVEPFVFRLNQNLAFACPVHRAARPCFSESSATIIHLVSSRRISRRLSSRTLNPINSVSFLGPADRTIRSIFSIAKYSEMSFCKSVFTATTLKDPLANKGLNDQNTLC